MQQNNTGINVPSKKKLFFKVNENFSSYLKNYNRNIPLPLQYDDLLRFNQSISLLNAKGEDTLWQTVYYQESDMIELFESLTYIYTLLKADGDKDILKHLTVSRVDYCTFGNSKPFRIRIINRLNDNYDHFYVKVADASRIYGLELEETLSPNSVMYMYDKNTLIEEHIAGIPGDDFILKNLEESKFNQIRIAKEFVKFNERCFVRLLGDMRSYNYVVDITPDIESLQYRMRAIDFDQQSYEGRMNFYLPQYFKENNPIIFLGIKHMKPETVRQYQLEERSLIGIRYKASKERVEDLLELMKKDTLAPKAKVDQLKKELAKHHKNKEFLKLNSMGELVEKNIQLLLSKDFLQSNLSDSPAQF